MLTVAPNGKVIFAIILAVVAWFSVWAVVWAAIAATNAVQAAPAAQRYPAKPDTRNCDALYGFPGAETGCKRYDV